MSNSNCDKGCDQSTDENFRESTHCHETSTGITDAERIALNVFNSVLSLLNASPETYTIRNLLHRHEQSQVSSPSVPVSQVSPRDVKGGPSNLNLSILSNEVAAASALRQLKSLERRQPVQAPQELQQSIDSNLMPSTPVATKELTKPTDDEKETTVTWLTALTRPIRGIANVVAKLPTTVESSAKTFEAKENSDSSKSLVSAPACTTHPSNTYFDE